MLITKTKEKGLRAMWELPKLTQFLKCLPEMRYIKKKKKTKAVKI